MQLFFKRCLPAALLLTLAAAVRAQPATASDTTGTAYTGPRYPGGPDSLRAYLRRHRLPGSEPVYLQVELTPATPRAEAPQILTPPGQAASPARALAAARALDAMPAWTPGRQDVPYPITTLSLGLNLPAGATALAYADEMPVFAGFRPGIIGLYEYLPGILVLTPAMRRDKRSGEVYVYFEVSEAGRVEQARVLEGSQPDLNAAALQTIARLPARALRPARLRGRPVRIYYVLSLVFHVE